MLTLGKKDLLIPPGQPSETTSLESTGRLLYPPHRARTTHPLPGSHCSHRGLVLSHPSSVLLALGFQMMSFSRNPFPSRSRFDVSGTVGGLRLTSSSGHPISVKNVTQNIEVGSGVLPEVGWHLAFSSACFGTKWTSCENNG